ncbi:arginine N-succinyltransferase [Noviherbaspirillum aridicola]|uniref:Arginine N-succinyltransferase n=1 Tax=Noviherbaspirillum aridicola TaxID=2849687 RepID=A0ABQ4Q9X7_9BURK|nr:arginine N-succinyltransferase [Noviherbaspirillum aridicola]GIZ53861.1 arginine N-succinyltransferase [Noviherbaspirillum aridicola]
MLIIRAIAESDIDGLLALAQLVGPGMTTLKPDRRALGARVEIACASFAEQIDPTERDYLFVMEDSERGAIVGACAVRAAVGLHEPFYNYRIGTLVHSSKELGVFSQLDTLYLSNDLTGSAELCSLFLHPDYRRGHHGKLLSRSRFLFIAQFPHLFPERLIAEMRGYQDEAGRSPFWDSLGQHFFRMDFSRADDLTSLGKKSFIAELMPRHPLYVAYLTGAAQEVIGQVHRDTAPAQRLLEQEGMHFEGYVDIFDAGPTLQARVSELRALRESELAIVDDARAAAQSEDLWMVARLGLPDFRVIATTAHPNRGRIELPPQERDLLHCRRGDPVRAMQLVPRRPQYGPR